MQTNTSIPLCARNCSQVRNIQTRTVTAWITCSIIMQFNSFRSVPWVFSCACRLQQQLYAEFIRLPMARRRRNGTQLLDRHRYRHGRDCGRLGPSSSSSLQRRHSHFDRSVDHLPTCQLLWTPHAVAALRFRRSLLTAKTKYSFWEVNNASTEGQDSSIAVAMERKFSICRIAF